jgi:hypothetical protein
MVGKLPSVVLTLPESFERAELADGTPFPKVAKIEALVAGTTGPLFEITLAVEAGQPVVTRLAVERTPGDAPLSTSAIRDLVGPLVEVVIDYTARATQAFSQRGPLDRPQAVAAGDSALRLRRRRTVDDELLREVAEVWSPTSKTPTEDVADHFFTSHRNASRWVAEARRRGFIPPHPTKED